MVPSTQKPVFFFLFLQLNVGASLYRMIYVQSLTLEGCFRIHLLQVESFHVLTENPILRDGPTHMITNSLEANYGPIFNLQKCDVET